MDFLWEMATVADIGCIVAHRWFLRVPRQVSAQGALDDLRSALIQLDGHLREAPLPEVP